MFAAHDSIRLALQRAMHGNDWFEEFRLFHREDGKVVKVRDDLMSTTRYGVMMLRHAQTDSDRQSFSRVSEYPDMRAFV